MALAAARVPFAAMAKVMHVVGTRPNFVKIAPLIEALRRYPDIDQRLIHTGQHYDPQLVDVFFAELGLPRPDRDLDVGSGSHVEQTAAVMVRLAPVLVEDRPDLVVVVGDVNSTLAAALVAAKLGVPVAHVEAGLRSFDRSMPEEINRIVTDQLSTLLFAPSEEAAANLRREGIDAASIAVVGNVMLDTLLAQRDRLSTPALSSLFDLPALSDRGYAVLTLHRPANVDEPPKLRALLARLRLVAEHLPVVFPVHPRTRDRLLSAGLDLAGTGLHPVDPLGYRAFLGLMARAACVLTDSGGIQEETSALDVPCFTIRDNTEWPDTLTAGTNTLVGADARGLAAALDDLLRTGGRRSTGPAPDGRVGERIAEILASHVGALRPLPLRLGAM
jgi:UDP-N-acetylglucosamine 2-epimerase (non-hydrolysing)